MCWSKKTKWRDCHEWYDWFLVTALPKQALQAAEKAQQAEKARDTAKKEAEAWCECGLLEKTELSEKSSDFVKLQGV